MKQKQNKKKKYKSNLNEEASDHDDKDNRINAFGHDDKDKKFDTFNVSIATIESDIFYDH